MRLKQVLAYDDGKNEGKKKMKRTRKKMKEIFGERGDIFSVEQFEIIIVISTKVYKRFNSIKLLLFHSIQYTCIVLLVLLTAHVDKNIFLRIHHEL